MFHFGGGGAHKKAFSTLGFITFGKLPKKLLQQKPRDSDAEDLAGTVQVLLLAVYGLGPKLTGG